MRSNVWFDPTALQILQWPVGDRHFSNHHTLSTQHASSAHEERRVYIIQITEVLMRRPAIRSSVNPPQGKRIWAGHVRTEQSNTTREPVLSFSPKHELGELHTWSDHRPSWRELQYCRFIDSTTQRTFRLFQQAGRLWYRFCSPNLIAHDSKANGSLRIAVQTHTAVGGSTYPV